VSSQVNKRKQGQVFNFALVLSYV